MKSIFFVSVIIVLLFCNHDYAGAVCVIVPEANLRGGPGVKYDKTWEVFKYMPFKKISRKGNWYKVQDVDGDRHWIHRKLVTDRFNCAVVKVEKAYIRSGPGTRFRKNNASPGLKYDSFRVLERKGKWVKVQDEYNERGWIFRELLWIY